MRRAWLTAAAFLLMMRRPGGGADIGRICSFKGTHKAIGGASRGDSVVLLRFTSNVRLKPIPQSDRDDERDGHQIMRRIQPRWRPAKQSGCALVRDVSVISSKGVFPQASVRQAAFGF